MLRYKQFVGSGQDLERAVNAWLEQNDPDVTHLVQSQGVDGSIALSFVFQESFRAQENRLAREHGLEQATQPVVSLEDIAETPLPVGAEQQG